MLPINSIQHVHDDAFKDLSSLQNLNMTGNKLNKPPFLKDICDTLLTIDFSNNQISEITDGHFIGCAKVLSLNLKINLIKELTNLTLIGLDSLEQLQLEKNAISSIECHAFWGLSSVTNIELHNNKLRDFPCYCFRNNSAKMKSITIFVNPIENIDVAAVKCIPSIESIYFHYTAIKNFDFIAFLPNLKSLKLLSAGSFATNIMTFSSSFALNYIQIHYGDLHEFPVFSVSKNITTELDLRYNIISCIDVPRITGLVALRYLNLDYNDLRHFPSHNCPLSDSINVTEASFSFPSLERIQMNYNRLEVFPVLPGLAHLLWVELNNNSISQFPGGNLAILTTVLRLELSHNSANSFPDFSMLPTTNQLAIIYLDNNRINSIAHARISTLVHLQELTLDHNYIDALSDMEFCLPQLWHFPLHHNLLQDLIAMIAQTGGQWKLVKWDISHNNLTNIPKPLMVQLASLEYLDASFNLIEEMPYLTAVAENITHVNLSYNQINTIPTGYMINLLSLEYLDLRENLLTEFPFWTLSVSTALSYLDLQGNMLSTLPRDIVGLKLSDTAVIDIRYNSLLCDQRLCWMRHYKPLWLLRDLSPCVAPAPLVGTAFDDLTDRQLGCLCKSMVLV